MKLTKLLQICIVLIVLNAVNLFAIDISGCVNITSSGSYTLTTDIINSGINKCIFINTTDVTLNCNNHIVDGTDQATYSGIYSEYDNTIIHNCNVTDWRFGVLIINGTHGKVYDSIFDSNDVQFAVSIALDLANNTEIYNNIILNGEYGILDDGAWSVNIHSNYIKNMSSNGIFMDMDPDHSIIRNNTIFNSTKGLTIYYGDNMSITENYIGNCSSTSLELFKVSQCDASYYAEDCTGWPNIKDYFYNNIFNSSTNVNIILSQASYWSITPIEGTNIYNTDNPYIGGNFWANPAGTGYSQTCTDSDENGFCAAYTVASGNIDYYPLSTVYVYHPPPIPEIVTATNSARESVFAAFAILTLIIIAAIGITLIKVIESGDASMITIVAVMALTLAVVIMLGYFILGNVQSALLP